MKKNSKKSEPICPKCNWKGEEGDLYCHYCGTPLSYNKKGRFIEEKEIMKCSRCGKKYEDLKMKECPKCGLYLEKTTTYNIFKKLKTIVIVSIILIVIIVTLIYALMTLKKDLDRCYWVVKTGQSFENFEDIMDKHFILKTKFEEKAYNQLYKALDEHIEQIKNGKKTGFFRTTDSISWTNMDEEKEKIIKEKIVLAKAYTEINNANEKIKEEDYIEAYDILRIFIIGHEKDYKDITNIVIAKKDEIQEITLQQAITKAQEQISQNSYYSYLSAQKILKNFKNLGNQTVLDMYNKATTEVDRIEAEQRAQAQAEQKAQQQKQAEEQARKEAEEKARKKSQGVDIGMTQQDVLDSSWGKPKDINRTVTENHVYEQWVYGYPNYLYFTDGILTSIQN